MPFDAKRYEKVQEILGEPDLYPAELLSWILKKLTDNPYFQVSDVQLPTADDYVSVGDAGQPTFVSPWAHYGGGFLPASWRKDPFGTVFIDGLVKTTSAVLTNTTIFTLPAGYRPKASLMHSQHFDAGGAGSGECRVDYYADGRVQYIGPGGTVSYLSIGMAFKAFS